MPNYPNLPGVSIEVLQGQMTLKPQDSASRVLIIGNVPAGVKAPEEPVLVTSVSTIRDTFGGFIVGGEPNQLALEWKAVTQESKARVYLLALKGATDKEKFVNLYEDLFTYLVDFEIDHILLTGMYAGQTITGITAEDFEVDETKEAFPNLAGVEKVGEAYTANPALMLAVYAEQQSLELHETIAYIGVEPVKGTSIRDIAGHVKKLVAQDNEYSHYLQVVAGPETSVTVEGSIRAQWTSGVGSYAGLVLGLLPQNAPTNQKLKGYTSLRYMFSLRQLDQLVGKKYVTFNAKRGNIVVVDGVTTAPDLMIQGETQKSDFTRLSTLRITNYMTNAIRNVCEPFIGLPTEGPLYTSLNSAIKSEITGAIEAGIIQDARFQVYMGESFDTAQIELTILPQFEMRTINVVIGLSDPVTFAQGSTTETETP